jgi:hypothetical protein
MYALLDCQGKRDALPYFRDTTAVQKQERHSLTTVPSDKWRPRVPRVPHSFAIFE